MAKLVSYWCDVCMKSVDNEADIETISLPCEIVISRRGPYSKTRTEMKPVDLCQDCFKKYCLTVFRGFARVEYDEELKRILRPPHSYLSSQ